MSVKELPRLSMGNGSRITHGYTGCYFSPEPGFTGSAAIFYLFSLRRFNLGYRLLTEGVEFILPYL